MKRTLMTDYSSSSNSSNSSNSESEDSEFEAMTNNQPKEQDHFPKTESIAPSLFDTKKDPSSTPEKDQTKAHPSFGGKGPIEFHVEKLMCRACRKSEDEENMLACDSCNTGWHFQCLDPPIEEPPIEWLCPQCLQEKVLETLDQIMKKPIAKDFNFPVEPVALNLPNYFQIVKKPMDFSTIKKKLSSDEYATRKEFMQDIQLIFSNCRLVHSAEAPIVDACNTLEKEIQSAFEYLLDPEASMHLAITNKSKKIGKSAKKTKDSKSKTDKKSKKKRKKEDDMDEDYEEEKQPPKETLKIKINPKSTLPSVKSSSEPPKKLLIQLKPSKKNNLNFDSILKDLPKKKEDSLFSISPERKTQNSPPEETEMSNDETVGSKWTEEEDRHLREAVQEFGFSDWGKIAEKVGHTNEECLSRWIKIRDLNGNIQVSQKEWTKEEDLKLSDLIEKHKFQWGQISKEMKRTVKDCKERWNFQKPKDEKKDDRKRIPWTVEEDEQLVTLQAQYGNKWTELEKFFPSRTANSIKNHWLVLSKKKEELAGESSESTMNDEDPSKKKTRKRKSKDNEEKESKKKKTEKSKPEDSFVDVDMDLVQVTKAADIQEKKMKLLKLKTSLDLELKKLAEMEEKEKSQPVIPNTLENISNQFV